MRKRILITIAAAVLTFLLASCDSEDSDKLYRITYEKCSGWTGELISTKDWVFVETYRQAVPIMYVGWYDQRVLNVCSYQIDEIKKIEPIKELQ